MSKKSVDTAEFTDESESETDTIPSAPSDVYVIDDSDFSPSADDVIFVADDSDDSTQIMFNDYKDKSNDSSEFNESSKSESFDKQLTERLIYKKRTTSIEQVKENYVTKNDFILVSDEELEHIFDLKQQKFATFSYVSYFAKQMEKYVPCTLRSKGTRVCKKTFTVKFKCMHYPDCRREYQLVCKRREKIEGCYAFRILFSKNKIHHTRKIVRQCRGIDKKQAMRKLAKRTVTEHRESVVSKGNKRLFKKGNLQNLYSVEVMRKLRSEA